MTTFHEINTIASILRSWDPFYKGPTVSWADPEIYLRVWGTKKYFGG